VVEAALDDADAGRMPPRQVKPVEEGLCEITVTELRRGGGYVHELLGHVWRNGRRGRLRRQIVDQSRMLRATGMAFA
jgi:hypothetical protein